MTEAVNIERILVEYFHNVKAVLRRLGNAGSQYVGSREKELLNALTEAKRNVYEALMDDFDTPAATNFLVTLIRDSNRYIESSSSNPPSSVVLSSVARYVTSVLKTFGLVPSAVDIGFPVGADGLSEGSESGAGVDKESTLTPYLDVLTKFRSRCAWRLFRGAPRMCLWRPMSSEIVCCQNWECEWKTKVAAKM